ncbi:MAG: hypothetical protein AB1454_01920 [Candidatus Auribacterota bacterium]
MSDTDNNLPENDEPHGSADKESLKKISAFILKQMQKGKTRAEITQQFVEQGIEETTASGMVDEYCDIFVRRSISEQWTAFSLIPSIIGGLIAAIVGGLAWGLIVKHTEYELGLAAVGVGWLCAWSILFFNNGKKGVPVQIIAGLTSIAGILIGKYCFYFFQVQKIIETQHGAIMSTMVSPFSIEVMKGFIPYLIDMTAQPGVAYDVLWILFAVGSTWRITRSLNLPQADDSVSCETRASSAESMRRSLMFTAIGAAVIYLLFSQLSKQAEIPLKSSLNEIQQDNVQFVVENMKLAGNTYYYFNLIAPEHVTQMQDEMMRFIAEHTAQGDLLAEIENLKKDHEAFSLELAKVEIPDSFYADPSSDRELFEAFYIFFLKELKLYLYTNLYVTYFNRGYDVTFDNDTNTAIEQVYTAFFKLQAEHDNEN